MKKYILLIVVSLSLVACKKKSTIHITAKNIVTGKPYSGLKYSVLRSKTGLFENHYKTVASGTLDENGEAYITKYFAKNWSHDLSLELPENTCYSKKDHYYFSGGENVEANFEYAECGYLKLSINNTSCFNDSDKISVYRKLLSIPNHETWSATHPYIQHGCEQTISPSYFSVIMGKYHFWWKVTKNNITNIYNDTVYIQAGEYKTYTINY